MSSPQRWTLAVVCAATTMLTLDIAAVNTAASRIAADLHTGLSGLQWVIDAYTLGLAIAVLSAGSLADRLGRRRVFMGGMALFTLASLSCAAAPGIVALDAARGVQGIGAAGMFAVALALLAQAFPGPRERAAALAAYGTTVGVAFAVGPLVGGLLAGGLAWQWIFLVNVPIGVVGLVVTRRFVAESRDPRARRIDWAGQGLLAGGLLLLVVALLRGDDAGWTSAPILSSLAGAALALAAFVVVQGRVRAPMLPMRLFRDGTFAGAQVASFAMGASFFGLFFYTTLYLQGVLALSPIQAGLVYLPGTVLMAVVANTGRRLVTRLPAGRIVSVALALAALGMLLLTLAGADSSWAIALPGLLVALAGVGMFNPALAAIALGSVAPEDSGVGAGANATFRLAGLAIGVAAFGALIPAGDALGGGDPAAYVAGYHHALLAGAALAGGGALAVAALIPGVRVRRRVVAAAGRPLPEPA